MDSIVKIIENLRHYSINQILLIFLLYFSRIYDSLKNYCERDYLEIIRDCKRRRADEELKVKKLGQRGKGRTKLQKWEQQQKLQHHCYLCNALQEIDYTSKLSARTNIKDVEQLIKTALIECSLKKEPIRTGFPSMLFLFRFYEYLSNTFMIYSVLRFVLPIQWLITKCINLVVPAYCYLPGRLVLHGSIPFSQNLLPLVCLLHLIWRCVHQWIQRPLKINLLVFMLQKNEDIDRQFKTMGEQFDGSKLNNLDQDINYRDRFIQSIMYYPIKKRTSNSSGLDGDDDDDNNTITIYKLRPNRTAYARKQTNELLTKLAAVTILAFIPAFGIITSTVLSTLLHDIYYIVLYPNCYPALEKLKAEGRLDPSSIHMDNHKLITFFVDGIENLVVWIDSGLAIFFVVPSTLLLNHDLLIYWRHLQDKLGKLLNEMKLEQIRCEFVKTRYIREDGYLTINAAAATTRRMSLISELNNFVSNTEKSLRNRALEESVLDIQTQASDLFHQIEAVDLYTSDVLTACFVNWLACVCALTYFSLTLDEISSWIRLIQICSFILILLPAWHLLSLNRCTNLSYRTLCSLMAHDNSKYKLGFVKLLEFYTKRNSYCYTLVHTYPFTGTVLISLITWTLSGTMIVEQIVLTMNLERHLTEQRVLGW